MATTPTITSNSTTTSASTATDAYSTLSSSDFVKIMFSALQQQDPLNPSDTNALMQQMSSLRSIQSSLDLSTQLNNMVAQNQLANSGALLGKTITGLNENSTQVQGTVTSVAKTDTGPVLVLDTGDRVPFNSIEQMFGTTTPGTPSTGTATP